METWFRLMHTPTSRIARVFLGLWIVIAGAQMAAAAAFGLAMLGTAIAVTGIADICPMELMVKHGS
jgi:hypothetical protein